MLYIISIYFNKYILHVLCTYFNLYDCSERVKLNCYYYWEPCFNTDIVYIPDVSVQVLPEARHWDMCVAACVVPRERTEARPAPASLWHNSSVRPSTVITSAGRSSELQKMTRWVTYLRIPYLRHIYKNWTYLYVQCSDIFSGSFLCHFSAVKIWITIWSDCIFLIHLKNTSASQKWLLLISRGLLVNKAYMFLVLYILILLNMD